MVKGLLGVGAPDPAEVARGEGLVREFAGVLDAHLAGREWICGDGISLADIAVAAPFAALPAKLPVTDLKNVQRWFAAMQTLEVWKKTALP